MIYAAVVEDSAFDRKVLVDCLREYEAETGNEMNIRAYSSGDKLMERYPDRLDILFLDIMMEGMDGMRTAHMVRRQDENVILFFVTNMVQYAIQGYSVDAMDFIVKPVAYPAIKLRLDRALRRLARDETVRIGIAALDGICQVAVNEICFLETCDHKVIVHTTDRDIVTRTTLHSLEKSLEPFPFFRCHASYLVNLRYVDKIQGNDIWVNGRLLSISRYRRKEFLEAWSVYLGR